MMRKILLGMAIFFGIVALSMYSQAAVLKVPQDYADIQTAVDAATDGDTIMVGPGEYVGVFIMGKHVKIMGSGPRTLIYDDHENPDYAGDGITILGPGASGTEVSNLAIDLTDATFPPGWIPVGIGIYGANDVTVSRVEIRNTTFAGIYARNAENLQITQNKIIGFPDDMWLHIPRGIFLYECTNSLVSFNQITSLPEDQSSAIGIFLYSKGGPTTGNSVVHNRIAVNTESTESAYAILLIDKTMDEEKECEDLHDNLIAFNDLRGSEKYDIYYIGGYPDCVFTANIIYRNFFDSYHDVPPPLPPL